MRMQSNNIQLISAPSILGLKQTGVEWLSDSLISAGLHEKLKAHHPPLFVRTLNPLYWEKRDPDTGCLNTRHIVEFSETLGNEIYSVVSKNRFALTLGGDCSILLGIMPALKKSGRYGLIFIDAHADFYSPEASATGEVADMDLAIVCGRGPRVLTDIRNAWPYVQEENVIHIGQRDEEETKQFGSPEIKETSIKCFDLKLIREKGIERVNSDVLEQVSALNVDGLWIHYDTDSLSDDLNPAVDYRIPGGLTFDEVELIQGSLLKAGKVAGMSITCFNPTLDRSGRVAGQIVDSLVKVFSIST